VLSFIPSINDSFSFLYPCPSNFMMLKIEEWFESPHIDKPSPVALYSALYLIVRSILKNHWPTFSNIDGSQDSQRHDGAFLNYQARGLAPQRHGSFLGPRGLNHSRICSIILTPHSVPSSISQRHRKIVMAPRKKTEEKPTVKSSPNEQVDAVIDYLREC
jgi:hypothetical protein